MNYILGGSYKSLLFALYLKKVKGEKTTIVTYKLHLIEFCKKQNIDYIKFDNIPIGLLTIGRFFSLKEKLDDLIKRINPKKKDRFFLPVNIKAPKFFYLAKELSKKGYIVCYKMLDLDGCAFGKYKAPWYKPVIFKSGIMRVIFKIFLDLDLVYYYASNHPFLGIDNSFLKKYDIKEYDQNHSSEELIFEALKEYKKEIEPGKFDCFIVVDDCCDTFNQKSLETMWKNILEFPADFAYKKHPAPKRNENEIKYYNIFNEIKELPDYLPAEIFFSNISGNVISVCSSALITASKYPNIKTISLLELVKWKSEENKNDWKKTLIKTSNNKILFPDSFEELKQLLLNVD